MFSTLYYDYFLCNLKEYTGVDFPITAILFYLTLGLILATFFLYYQNRTILFALKRLYKHKCIDRESAKTIEELHLTKRKYILYMLKHPSMLAHYIHRVPKGTEIVSESVTNTEEKNTDAPQQTETKNTSEDTPPELSRIDFTTDKFYLDETYFPRAKGIIDRGEEPLSRPILSSLAFLVVFAVLFFTMPSILSLLF